MKGFIINRQAKLTPYQANHLHFYTPTKGLEADRMVDALNRLDQTDALVEQIIGDRAKVEQSANRGQVHSTHYMQVHPPEARFPRGLSQTTTPFTVQSRTLRASSWIGTLSVSMMMVALCLTRTGPLWYLFRETDRWTQFVVSVGTRLPGGQEKSARFRHWTG